VARKEVFKRINKELEKTGKKDQFISKGYDGFTRVLSDSKSSDGSRGRLTCRKPQSGTN
jgi:hypothetical protein